MAASTTPRALAVALMLTLSNAFHSPSYGKFARSSSLAHIASKDAPTTASRGYLSVQPTKKKGDVVATPPKDRDDAMPPSDGLGASSANGGNLALVKDTWIKIPDGQRSEHYPSRLSSARIDVEPSIDTIVPDTGALSWSVSSNIKFTYNVIETPNLLDPANDALLFGHIKPADRHLAKATAQRRLVVIDEYVDDLYGAALRNYFDKRGMAKGTDYEVLRLPMVEDEKSIELALKVCEAMKKFNIPRRASPVIAIGGGVCLDVVGLAATLFRRKTPYIRVPTTTLAYVDASVGAKSGVNFMGSKNRLGAYVPPVAALLDSSFLRTEEERAVASGVAEMSKMALMKSPELFGLLESHAPRLVAGRFQPSDDEDQVPGRVLQLSIDTMLEELAPNLWEASLDRLVDFGHAVGQELEMHALGTEYELTHGESVNVDMAFMTILAKERGLIDTSEQARILKMLSSYGCPIWHPLMTRKFMEHALEERRKLSMGLRLPLPIGVGEAAIFHDVEKQECFDALEKFHKICGPSGYSSVGSTVVYE